MEIATHSTILVLHMVVIFMGLISLVDAIDQLDPRLPQYGTTQMLIQQLIAARQSCASKNQRTNGLSPTKVVLINHRMP